MAEPLLEEKQPTEKQIELLMFPLEKEDLFSTLAASGKMAPNKTTEEILRSLPKLEDEKAEKLMKAIAEELKKQTQKNLEKILTIKSEGRGRWEIAEETKLIRQAAREPFTHLSGPTRISLEHKEGKSFWSFEPVHHYAYPQDVFRHAVLGLTCRALLGEGVKVEAKGFTLPGAFYKDKEVEPGLHRTFSKVPNLPGLDLVEDSLGTTKDRRNVLITTFYFAPASSKKA